VLVYFPLSTTVHFQQEQKNEKEIKRCEKV
jgi:hypothetical protein